MKRSGKDLTRWLLALLMVLAIALPAGAAEQAAQTAAVEQETTAETETPEEDSAEEEEPVPAEQLPEGVEESYTVTYGEQEEYDLLREAFGVEDWPEGTYTFALAEPEEEDAAPVLELDETTGVFRPLRAGTAQVTVVEAQETGLVSYTIQIVVEKGTPVFSGRETSYTVSYSGRTYNWGNVTATGDGALTFTSSNPEVATVDAETGVITQTGVGETTITVTAAETDCYREAVFTSTITINKGVQKFTGRTTSYTVAYSGRTYNWSNLKASGGGELTFASSNTAVATVDAKTGVITQTGVGTTIITAVAPETELYQETTFRSTITITKGTQKITGINSRYCVGYQSGRTYNWGKGAMLTLAAGDGTVSYSTSNASVIAVNAKTGVLTVKGKGTAYITITVSETSRYNKLTFRSEVTVKTAQTVSGLRSSYTASYGASKSYNWGSWVKSTSGSGSFTYTSSNPKVATVDAKGVVKLTGVGTTVISVRAAETTQYAPATFKSTVTVTKGGQTLTGIAQTVTLGYSQGSTVDWGAQLKHTGDGTVTYSSNNTSVITVDSKTGVLTQQGKGLAVITIRASETTLYKAATYKVSVYVKEAPVLGGIKSAYTVTYTASKTYNWGNWLTNTGDGAATYTSSNSGVVSVNAKTGVLTLEGPGTAVITITTAATDRYSSATLKSTVTVNQSSKPLTYDFSSAYKNGSYYTALMKLTMGSSQRENLLAVAESQLGYTEGSSKTALSGSAGGSGNYTEFGYWYYNNVDSGGSYYRYAWCNMFVSWCAYEAGISQSVVPREVLVPDMQQDFEDQGRYYTWKETVCGGGSKKIQAGDLIFYSSSSGSGYEHIGIVTSVTVSGSKVTIKTIEGNSTGNACCTRQRTTTVSSGGKLSSAWYIRGFACPNYAS